MAHLRRQEEGKMGMSEETNGMAAVAALTGMMSAHAYERGLILVTPTGRDGAPIRVGDTVYGGDGRAWKVKGIGSEPYSVVGKCGEDYREMRPEWLSHSKPDTWAALYRETRCGMVAWGEFRDRVASMPERG